jgi:hypothetical protein
MDVGKEDKTEQVAPGAMEGIEGPDVANDSAAVPELIDEPTLDESEVEPPAPPEQDLRDVTAVANVKADLATDPDVYAGDLHAKFGMFD